MGEALGDFLLVDSESSNVYRTMYAHILVEIDVSRGSFKRLSWPLLMALGFNFLIMRESPSDIGNAIRPVTLLCTSALKWLNQRSHLLGGWAFHMIPTWFRKLHLFGL